MYELFIDISGENKFDPIPIKKNEANNVSFIIQVLDGSKILNSVTYAKVSFNRSDGEKNEIECSIDNANSTFSFVVTPWISEVNGNVNCVFFIRIDGSEFEANMIIEVQE